MVFESFIYHCFCIKLYLENVNFKNLEILCKFNFKFFLCCLEYKNLPFFEKTNCNHFRLSKSKSSCKY